MTVEATTQIAIILPGKYIFKFDFQVIVLIVHGIFRYILDLKDSVDSTDDDIAKEIANKLCEQKDELMSEFIMN